MRHRPESTSGRPRGGSSGRVLVTEGEHRGVVAVCRSLARAGYEVVVAAQRRPAASHWSRACHVRLSIANPGTHPDRFLAELEPLVRHGRFDLLLLGGERSLIPVSEHRATFEPHVKLGLPDHRTVLRSLDKLALLDAAAAAGLEPPQTSVCEDAAAAHAAVRALGLPVIAKPRRSVLTQSGELLQRPVRVVSREADLDEALAAVEFPAIVQRYEEHSRRLSTAGVMTDQGVVGFVATRFLRTWPPDAGAVCFAETVPAPTGLVDRAAFLLDALGWRGIFELELLVLGAGRLGAIDLNPRVFGWLELAIAAGADLPRLWVDALAGKELLQVEPIAGVRYRWEEADLAHFLWQLRRARVREAARVALPRRRVVHAHFRARDPGPLAARALELARRRSPLGKPALRNGADGR